MVIFSTLSIDSFSFWNETIFYLISFDIFPSLLISPSMMYGKTEKKIGNQLRIKFDQKLQHMRTT